jgi:hypothetical protein
MKKPYLIGITASLLATIETYTNTPEKPKTPEQLQTTQQTITQTQQERNKYTQPNLEQISQTYQQTQNPNTPEITNYKITKTINQTTQLTSMATLFGLIIGYITHDETKTKKTKQ